MMIVTQETFLNCTYTYLRQFDKTGYVFYLKTEGENQIINFIKQ